MTHLLNDLFAVPVPEDATEPEFNEGARNVLMFLTHTHIDHVTLPPGYFQYLFLSSQATEEEWKQIVGNPPYANRVPQNMLSKDYKGLWLQTAKECGESLLTSKGITSNCAIIKKLDDGSKAINSDLPLLP